MYGQASPRWPTSIALCLMVAFFGVYLNFDLYLASPVTDDSPGDSNNLAEHAKTEHPEHHSTDPTHDAAMCMVKHHEETKTCQEKAAKEDFAEITDKNCSKRFSSTKCFVEILCGKCKDANVEVSLKKTSEDLEKEVKEKCKQWESKAPKVSSACPGGGQRSGGGSDSSNTGLVIGIVVVVVLVVAVVIAVIVYCLMCAGDSKGHSAKPSGKSSKGSKSKKSGKSSKSRKSGKSSKGGKSTKSAKSAKSSKGGKSAKK